MTSSHETRQSEQSAESGQAIIIIALFMLALVGMVGLAVDGGRMFLAYRQAQAAVDAIAVSAAYDRCTGNPNPIPNAVAKMDREYGYHDDNPNHQVDIDLGPLWTEDTAPHGDQNYVGARIRDTLDPFFIQLIYPNDLVISATAVTQCNMGSHSNDSDNGGYAFRSLSDKDDCAVGSPSMDLRGSKFDIYGDIWVGSLSGNPDLHTNINKDPKTTDNPIDIFGDIRVQADENDPKNNQVTTNNGLESIAEDLPRAPHNVGGDGEIEFGAPAPSNGALPYTMDYFRPAGSTLCTSPGECGALQNQYPGAYYDVSNFCSHGVVNHQDFTDPNFPNWAGNTLGDGIYYASCRMELNNELYSGNISLISEGQIDLSSSTYNLTGYAGEPVVVSNHGNSSTNCNDGTAAVKYNAPNSTIEGDTIAFKGIVTLNGVNFKFYSCVTAHGIRVLGNAGAEYWCTASEGDDGVPSIRVNE